MQRKFLINKNIILFPGIVLLLVYMLSSCQVYRQNILFETEQALKGDTLSERLGKDYNKNYTLEINDYIKVFIYSNHGERLIDPDFELAKTSGQIMTQKDDQKYLMREDGYVNLPMVGQIYLKGRTLRESDSILTKAYSTYFKDTYVITRVLNKRVVVIGPVGGKVIPLENENMNMIEIIAIYGGMNNESKAQNIRRIRGDLKNPQVDIINLRTIDGMRQATLNVEPNDIIYIEPQRRLLPETLKDIYPLISVITSVFSLVILMLTLNRTSTN